ncbi:MAG: FliH/SctL family protein [Verrucomicrobiota bacterium]|jgi:flagellar assembly protein FliH
MKWCKFIILDQPLLEARVVAANPSQSREASQARDSQLEQAAFDRGMAEGEKRLADQLLRQRAQLIELQNGVLASLRQAVPQVVAQCESGLIELALEVARKLVFDLPISVEMVEAAIRSAIAQAEERAELDVLLHADDLALLRQCNSPALLPVPGNGSIRFHNSAEVSRGGCLVQTRFGAIDARRETKLELIRQSLVP